MKQFVNRAESDEEHLLVAGHFYQHLAVVNETPLYCSDFVTLKLNFDALIISPQDIENPLHEVYFQVLLPLDTLLLLDDLEQDA